ncbi:MAG TPA: hypothetical protein VGC95_12175, partial [Chitinophagaceae bacterium]
LVEAVQEDQAIFMGGDTPQKIRSFAKGRDLPQVNKQFHPGPDTSSAVPANDQPLDPLFEKFADSVRRWQTWAQLRPQYIPTVQAEMDWSPEDVARLYQHRSDKAYQLGNKPLIVLTRGVGGFEGRKDSLELERQRLAAQHRLTTLSTNSRQIIDMNSGHNIHVEDPQQVIDAIREVYGAVRQHRRIGR